MNKFINLIGLEDYYFVSNKELHTLNSESAIMEGNIKIALYLIGEKWKAITGR